jgi:hypothetical protein
MKKWFFLLVLGGFLFGCSNDFELTDDWKDIPVVYGFLNVSDTAHYIRLEKAFLDPKTSALVVAKIPDSLYYNDAAVFLEKENGQRFALTRVDGAAEGFPRQTGIFAENPNYLYKIKQGAIGMTAGDTLKLVIERGDNLPAVRGATVILGTTILRSPSKITSTGLQFKTGDFFFFRWTPSPESQIFDLSATIRIQEQNIQTFVTTVRTIQWPIAKNIKRDPNSANNDVNFKIPASGFYRIIADNLQPDATVQRFISNSGIDFRVDAGGQEINAYNDVINANLGISGAELIPIYTNMSEGFGLFTSRSYSEEKGFGINQLTRDSLINGQFTRLLNFK